LGTTSDFPVFAPFPGIQVLVTTAAAIEHSYSVHTLLKSVL
jgi:hypothetical protein